ncbi:hypothetical protein L484_010851 [Morus notabilis]|uniref:Uncharacterized protein n=1 Tax=Morus notabilis TaxID=981085 RepID=W9T083_9ROSA|nr:hypothetical protein L484_010851 [Morus notabilis]
MNSRGTVPVQNDINDAVVHRHKVRDITICLEYILLVLDNGDRTANTSKTRGGLYSRLRVTLHAIANCKPSSIST